MSPSEVSELSVKDLSLPQLADEYTAVRTRMMAWRPAVNPWTERFTALSAELLARHAETPADQKVLVEGDRYIVPISPKEQETEIVDKLAVFKIVRKLGLEKTVETYSITLEKARKLLTAKQIKKYLKTERTGRRTIGEPVLKEAR